ncbi:hypothetical protein [Roseobacter fucihabitans]|nr:hypothetical protein [Roseobacter litoralis]
MRAQTLRLDDGVSEAAKIGASVAAACREESRQAAAVFISGKTPEAQAEFLKNTREDEAELATRVVNHTRATKS